MMGRIFSIQREQENRKGFETKWIGTNLALIHHLPADWFLASIMLIPLACSLFPKRHVFPSSCRYHVDLVIPDALGVRYILNEGLVLVFEEELHIA
jgi:hypothetical protein